ncbi:MAG: hypothetical protein JXX14_03225 [Deltaproteobacteria bacterium]|nr:hypothetical protein [Deltaproteobacteria bacterium]
MRDKQERKNRGGRTGGETGEEKQERKNRRTGEGKSPKGKRYLKGIRKGVGGLNQALMEKGNAKFLDMKV